MQTGSRGFLAAVLARVPSALTLSLLAGLAFWGAHTDWKLPDSLRFWAKGAAPPEESSEEGVKVLSEPDNVPGRTPGLPPRRVIEFPSDEAVEKAGIRLVPVEVRPLAPLPALHASLMGVLGGLADVRLAAATLIPGRMPLARYIIAQAAVDYDPPRYAHLTPRASGIVWQVYKEIGDPCRAGEVLALLDSAEVGRAKADLILSLSQVRLRTELLARLRTASGSGAVSERALLDAETSLRQAQVRLFNDHQALLNLGLPVRLQDLEALPDKEVVRKLRLLALPESVWKATDADSLTANLLPLTAPFDGTVIRRQAAVGEVVLTTHPKTLFVVADVHQLHIDLSVRPEDMPGVRLGQSVLFRPDIQGSLAAPARVSHISPEVDEKTRRVTVHAEVPNPDGRLRPNTFGTGQIILHEEPRALVVPRDAVQTDSGTPIVFVRISDRSFEARPVCVGLQEGDIVAVSGVSLGEEVVTTGSFALKSQLSRERIGGDE
jgi:cobalt-zinc-cadmium efflux system membrane fusion protein